MNRSLIESAGAGKVSIRSYTVGFILAVVLTALSFATVMSGEVSRTLALCVIFAAAAVQSLAHIHYFLHLDMSSKSRWNVLALAFTLLVMAIFIAGTIWIMYHLHQRLM
ncbi:MAG: cytochrome o ubiquinol oxidase subunit IV [Syntrophobacteraceae bacterium]